MSSIAGSIIVAVFSVILTGCEGSQFLATHKTTGVLKEKSVDLERQSPETPYNQTDNQPIVPPPTVITLPPASAPVAIGGALLVCQATAGTTLASELVCEARKETQLTDIDLAKAHMVSSKELIWTPAEVKRRSVGVYDLKIPTAMNAAFALIIESSKGALAPMMFGSVASEFSNVAVNGNSETVIGKDSPIRSQFSINGGPWVFNTNALDARATQSIETIAGHTYFVGFSYYSSGLDGLQDTTVSAN
ncbi:MAG: hypothetical protein EOP10_31460, partial [Proteobacteria bacterium]